MSACRTDNICVARLLMDYGANQMLRDKVSQLSVSLSFHICLVLFIG